MTVLTTKTQRHKEKASKVLYGMFCAFVSLWFIRSFAQEIGFAQETPAWEFFGGYSFQRSDVRQYFRSTPAIYSFRDQFENLNGWEFSLTENRNRWFGGTLDIRGHYNTSQFRGSANRHDMHSIAYGPRFSYRMSWANPFTHILLGAARATRKVTPVGPNASDKAFAVAAGLGLDVNLGTKAAVRLQADYFRTDVLGTRPNRYRTSAGVVFYLGKRE